MKEGSEETQGCGQDDSWRRSGSREYFGVCQKRTSREFLQGQDCEIHIESLITGMLGALAGL